MRGTQAFSVRSGDLYDMYLGYSSTHGSSTSEPSISGLAKRLVITVWWIEGNTGSGQRKASIGAAVWSGNGSLFDASSTHLQFQESGTENRMRFQYYCYDTTGLYGEVPTGITRFALWSSDVPVGEVYPLGDSRTVYVSWYWECGPDVSLLACSGAPVNNCWDPGPGRILQDYPVVVLARLEKGG